MVSRSTRAERALDFLHQAEQLLAVQQLADAGALKVVEAKRHQLGRRRDTHLLELRGGVAQAQEQQKAGQGRVR